MPVFAFPFFVQLFRNGFVQSTPIKQKFCSEKEILKWHHWAQYLLSLNNLKVKIKGFLLTASPEKSARKSALAHY